MLGGEDNTTTSGRVALAAATATTNAAGLKYVELLSFKRLQVGMHLMGVVQEVSERDVGVSLPHGLRGFVARALASDVHASASADSIANSNTSSFAGPSLRKQYRYVKGRYSRLPCGCFR